MKKETLTIKEIQSREGVAAWQGGMHFKKSVFFILSKKPVYEDETRDKGKIIIYEGHDIRTSKNIKRPKKIDQQIRNKSGTLTENGRFFIEAVKYISGISKKPLKVKVYYQSEPNKWFFLGFYNLIDCWKENQKGRKVFKFKIKLFSKEWRKRI